MYTWINTIVEGLRELGANNIYAYYDYLDIKIKKIERDSFLLVGNESLYFRDYSGMEVVFIRNDLNASLEKFILAHELGHAILHTEVYQAAFNKELMNVGKFEKQANYFAFKILNIKIDPIENEGFSLEQIANNLGLKMECFN